MWKQGRLPIRERKKENLEWLDIVNENGEPTGKTIDRASAHQKGIRHRTVHIWVLREENGKKQILLQKRSMEKESYPGEYDTSAAGHVTAGDLPLHAACRELEEELGIHAAEEELELIGTFTNRYDAMFHGSLFRDNEFTFVYRYKGTVELENLMLQKEEIESAGWFDFDAVDQACRQHAAADRPL